MRQANTYCETGKRPGTGNPGGNVYFLLGLRILRETVRVVRDSSFLVFVCGPWFLVLRGGAPALRLKADLMNDVTGRRGGIYGAGDRSSYDDVSGSGGDCLGWRNDPNLVVIA